MNINVINSKDGILDLKDEPTFEGKTAKDYFMLGVNAYVHEQYDTAIGYFDTVIDMEETNGKAYVNRGDIYAEMGMYEEAFNDYAMAKYLGVDNATEIAEELFGNIVEENRINAKDAYKLRKMLNLP